MNKRQISIYDLSGKPYLTWVWWIYVNHMTAEGNTLYSNIIPALLSIHLLGCSNGLNSHKQP